MVNPDEHERPERPNETDPFVLGEATLNRAKEVARRIAERVRKLTEDTGPEQKALDETREDPPVE